MYKSRNHIKKYTVFVLNDNAIKYVQVAINVIDDFRDKMLLKTFLWKIDESCYPFPH